MMDGLRTSVLPPANIETSCESLCESGLVRDKSSSSRLDFPTRESRPRAFCNLLIGKSFGLLRAAKVRRPVKIHRGMSTCHRPGARGAEPRSGHRPSPLKPGPSG